MANPRISFNVARWDPGFTSISNAHDRTNTPTIHQYTVRSLNGSKRAHRRIRGFLRGKEHFGYNVDLPRSSVVRGTEASFRLRRTWFRQVQDVPSGPRGVAKVHHIRENRRVSEADLIMNTTLHIC